MAKNRRPALDPSDGPTPLPARPRPALPGQVVLVLQGGGALGAYQVGVYEALHEAGIEPDWVIGTSIGAINASLIAGNPPAAPHRAAARLLGPDAIAACRPRRAFDWLGLGTMAANLSTVMRGIPNFFTPNLHALRGSTAALGVEAAAYYSTAPLRETLLELVDFDYLCECRTRMTVGAVNVGQRRDALLRHRARNASASST